MHFPILNQSLKRTILAGLIICLAAGLSVPPAAAQADKEWSITSLSHEIRELTRTTGPAVVQIYTSSFGALMGSLPQGAALFGKQQATGSGIILDAKGYILTNNHVVEGAKRVQVRLSPHALGVNPGVLDPGNRRRHRGRAGHRGGQGDRPGRPEDQQDRPALPDSR